MKKTIVIGASENPERYAYKATVALLGKQHEVIPVGLRPGSIHGIQIHTDRPLVDDVDTVTLYVGPQNQPAWEDYILELKPKRVIFNPGTENSKLQQKLNEAGIECQEACTLVLLSIGNY